MVEKLKVVIDTSIFVAAFMSKRITSSPKKVVNKWLKEDQFSLIMTPQIQTEIAETFLEKGINTITTQNLITIIDRNAVFCSGTYKVYTLDDIDPKDNIILSAALESEADYIVSLDTKHILPLKNYNLTGKVTQIVNDNTFLRQLEGNLTQEKKIELEIRDLTTNKILLKI